MSEQQSNEKSSPQVTKYQKFEVARVHRSQIKNAPYNPRFIDKNARTKLKSGIERDGLVEALAWNERTGNLVSGHQRIGILDDLNGTPDYYLDVCKINVSEKKEKSLNVFLNNPSAQGAFDFDGLKNLLSEDGATLDNFGFDKLEIDDILGVDTGEAFFDAPVAKVTSEKIKEIKDARKKMVDKGKERDDVNYYIQVVFQSSRSVENFFERAGLPRAEYVDGEALLNCLPDNFAPPKSSPT